MAEVIKKYPTTITILRPQLLKSLYLFAGRNGDLNAYKYIVLHPNGTAVSTDGKSACLVRKFHEPFEGGHGIVGISPQRLSHCNVGKTIEKIVLTYSKHGMLYNTGKTTYIFEYSPYISYPNVFMTLPDASYHIDFDNVPCFGSETFSMDGLKELSRISESPVMAYRYGPYIAYDIQLNGVLVYSMSLSWGRLLKTEKQKENKRIEIKNLVDTFRP